MGEGHTVISLVSMPRTVEIIRYFHQQGIELPAQASDGREPTVADVRSALRELEGYNVTYSERGDSLDIDLVHPSIDPSSSTRPAGADWAVIWIRNYKGPKFENSPCDLYFHRGTQELVVTIVRALARRCGPFIVMLYNERPLLVT